MDSPASHHAHDPVSEPHSEPHLEPAAVLPDGGGAAADAPFWPTGDPHSLTDEMLADAIDLDVVDRLVRGLPVTLDRYLPAIGKAASRPLSMDAAVDGALRAIVANGRPFRAAVEELGRKHPALKTLIDSTATITMLFGPSGAGAEETPEREPDLPARFGRPMPDGLGRFELLEALGDRKPARVFRAIDHLLSRPSSPVMVVVKILGRAADQAQLDEAIEEARLLRSLRHEAVVGLVDSGVSDDGRVYVITEYVEATSLRLWAESHDRPAVPKAVRLIATLARAVALAHREGVIHCDLSPSNILVDSGDRPRLVDFGSAVHVGPGASSESAAAQRVLRGTPGFMAPEQIDLSKPVNASMDVYALGSLLFWLLTGTSANGRDSAEIDAVLARRSDPARWRAEALSEALVPRAVAAIVLAAIDPDPGHRPADCETFAGRLDAWLVTHEHGQLPLSRRALAWARRRQGVTLLVAVGAAVVTTVIVVTLAIRPPEQRGVQDSLLAERANRAVGYAMTRYDHSLHLERDEARALLQHVPQILGTEPAPAATVRQWMSGPEAARLASLLSGLQVISNRHGESKQIESMVLRTALAAILLAQGRETGSILRMGGVSWEDALGERDPLRQVGLGLETAATARGVAEGLVSGRPRPGYPSPENVLVALDSSIKENKAAKRDVVVKLLSEQRDRLRAAIESQAGRPGPKAVSGGSPPVSGAPLPG